MAVDSLRPRTRSVLYAFLCFVLLMMAGGLALMDRYYTVKIKGYLATAEEYNKITAVLNQRLIELQQHKKSVKKINIQNGKP